MKNFLNLIRVAFIALPFSVFGQFPGCPMVDAGAPQTVGCGQPCVDLVATPFDAGATTSYDAFGIPHNPPILYNEPGGTPVSVGTDDVWSGVINLPFDFCFYGQTYSQVVVGSNGCVGFDIANASTGQPWSFSASCPSAALVPAGNIFGPYHDIDPSLGGAVNWYVLGTAPCRIFVVSFDAIPMFSCTTINASHMIVLYETTNAIDVYIQDKPLCSGWNSGNAVVGIQDMTGAQGIAAPGRNTGQWTVTTPEGWRFLPDGAPIYTLEWLEGGNVISTNDTITVCPSVPTTYVARATYTHCNGTTTIVEEDSVLVSISAATPTINELSNTISDCGAATGSVNVEGIGGAGGPFQFSINDTLNFQSSGSFTGLAPGTYTIFVEDANGCIGGGSITIGSPTPPDLSLVNVVNSTCGLDNGEIELSITGGTTPFSITANGGTPQSSQTITGLGANSYLIEVTDSLNCTDTLTVAVIAEPFPVISVTFTDTICASGSDGEVQVSGTGGIAPLMFAVDGGTPQADSLFTGLTPGTHDFQVIDSAGCTDDITVTIGTHPLPQIFADTFACNFSHTVQGTSSYAGGTWSAADTSIHFSNVTADNPDIWTHGMDGVFTVTFTDSVCNESVSTTIDFVNYPGTWLEDTTLCIGEEHIVSAPDNNPYPTTFEWSNGVLGTDITVSNPGGTYIVTMNNVCHENYDTVTVNFMLCDINAPNVLSIAQGSQNPLWYVQADGLGEYTVIITNRWGNVVYECTDNNAKCYWDGRNKNGVFVEEGTYFYMIEAKTMNGEEISKHGFITVVD